jgi:hypothetical protein
VRVQALLLGCAESGGRAADSTSSSRSSNLNLLVHGLEWDPRLSTGPYPTAPATLAAKANARPGPAPAGVAPDDQQRRSGILPQVVGGPAAEAVGGARAERKGGLHPAYSTMGDVWRQLPRLRKEVVSLSFDAAKEDSCCPNRSVIQRLSSAVTCVTCRALAVAGKLNGMPV